MVIDLVRAQTAAGPVKPVVLEGRDVIVFRRIMRDRVAAPEVNNPPANRFKFVMETIRFVNILEYLITNNHGNTHHES